MKRFTLFLAACFCFINGFAAYLRNVPVTVTQPDGTVLHCFASGDEFYNYLHDKDGYTIMQHPQTGYYVYAEKRDGDLVASNFVVGEHDPASKGLQPYALISPEEWMARRKSWEVPDRRPKNRDFVPNHGTLNNIGIFIRFSDDSEFTNTFSSIDNMFNDMSGSYSTSMRSYFQAASYGAIDIPTTFYPGHNGETIISYQDTYPRNYFEPYNLFTNPNGYQGDNERREREFSLLERAVNYVNGNNMIPSNLNIDYDNDGYVDNVCFIVRGNTGGWSELLWPHKWSLYDRTVMINGKIVDVFNFQLADDTGYFTTSTMCHEMNHSLSAPDLYHYYYGDDLSPVGRWDLMENNATPPQHCGAYMKMKYGHWIDEIPEITQAGTYTLNPISSATPENIAYKIPTDDPNQFYVLEYRDKNVETALYGSGLLIYRIDTHFDGNADYNPNAGIYDEVYIFRPGGTFTVNGNISKAFFNSSVNRPEFSYSTDPYPFYTGGTIDNNLRIYDITITGSTISFKYGSTASCEPPTNLAVSVDGRNATLTWDAATNAQSYNVYRDGTLIANTSNTSYTDSELSFGSYQYTLKSKDSNNRLSVQSAPVTADIYPIPSNLYVTKENSNAILTWDEPEWTVPTSPLATLSYGEGTPYYYWSYTYYAHRHLAADLAQYSNMTVYKISSYISYPGTYSVYVYSGTKSNNQPDVLSASIENVEVSASSSWYEFDLDVPVLLSGNEDLWIVMKQENTSQTYSIPSFDVSVHNTNAFYASTSSPSYLFDANSGYNCAWFIRACLTDGIYTYNLYDGTDPVATGISGASYTINNLANNTAHQYTLKTNFHGNETEASNMAGLALGNALLSSLTMNANDKMTVTEGSKLTVSGTLSDMNAENLILENGAQLVNNSANVKATMKKDITAFSGDEDGWYFIASPVTENITPSANNGLLANDYDLYLFNQSEELEWRNIEAGDFSTLNHKTGYLYANSGNTTLSFAGTLAGTTGATSLTYNGSAILKGLNLIGNPYPCNTTLNKDFYIINDNVVTLAGMGAEITPCEGVFVKATGSGQTATFSKATSKGNSAKDCFDIVVMQDKTPIDRARVRLGEGIGMEKFSLDDKHSQISLWQDGQRFAVAYVNAKNEMPLDFKAKNDGTYTINIELGDINLDYLHLIDNMTGEDVDLLTMPSYTFEAKTTDYASRFKLVFLR